MSTECAEHQLLQVRHIFEKTSEQTANAASKTDATSEDVNAPEESDMPVAETSAQPVLNALHTVADEHSSEVGQICR